MKAVITFTPGESKALIAKGLWETAEMKEALRSRAFGATQVPRSVQGTNVLVDSESHLRFLLEKCGGQASLPNPVGVKSIAQTTVLNLLRLCFYFPYLHIPDIAS